jgi:hypothetical protein
METARKTQKCGNWGIEVAKRNLNVDKQEIMWGISCNPKLASEKDLIGQ